ncbi:hypothetical protein BaRGS_00034777, partial [Batillaria attramentaria]
FAKSVCTACNNNAYVTNAQRAPSANHRAHYRPGSARDLITSNQSESAGRYGGSVRRPSADFLSVASQAWAKWDMSFPTETREQRKWKPTPHCRLLGGV